MSKIEVLEALQHLTLEETLEVIETASRMLRNNISPLPKLSLVQAADRMKAFYEPGHEHVQWVDEDPEEFQEYKDYA
jgi:antirestriction protein ArdC